MYRKLEQEVLRAIRLSNVYLSIMVAAVVFFGIGVAFIVTDVIDKVANPVRS